MALPPRAGADVPGWLLSGAGVVGRLLVLAAGVWVLAVLAAKLTLLCVAIFVALLIAGVFEPVTRAAAAHGWPDWVAPLAVVLVLLTASVATLAGLGARIAEQVPQLRDQLGQATRDMSQTLGIELPATGAAGGEASQGGQGQQGEQGQQGGQEQQSGQEQQAGVGGTLTAMAGRVLEGLIAFFLTLALAFLFLKDGGRMWAWIVSKCGRGIRADVDAAGRAAWRTLGSYVRGLTIVALFDAVGIGLGLLLLGVPLVLTLAVLQFLASYVPTIGAFVAGAVAVVIAYTSGGLTTALLTLLLVVAVQQVGNDVIEPWVMGHTLGLHPAVVLIAVTAGGLLWGIAGALLFVPLVAALSAAGHALELRRGVAVEPAPGG